MVTRKPNPFPPPSPTRNKKPSSPESETWTQKPPGGGPGGRGALSRSSLHIISHDLPRRRSRRNLENISAKREIKKLTGTVFFSSSDPPKSCPRISCVRPVGLMDDRHLSCFSFAAAADDLRSVCVWIMSNHTDKEDNLQSGLHKEVWESSKHQRVHKSLRWDEGASAGWTTSMSEKLILHLDPESGKKPAKPLSAAQTTTTCRLWWILYRLSIYCVCVRVCVPRHGVICSSLWCWWWCCFTFQPDISR